MGSSWRPRRCFFSASSQREGGGDYRKAIHLRDENTIRTSLHSYMLVLALNSFPSCSPCIPQCRARYVERRLIARDDWRGFQRPPPLCVLYDQLLLMPIQI